MNPQARPLAEIEEAELVSRAQRRDASAFEELMHRNTSTSLRLALSVLKDRQEAEDQVQTSFLKAWLGLGSFQSESRFSTWFRRIVLNQSLMRLRVVRRSKLESIEQDPEVERPKDLPSTSPSPEVQLSRRQTHDRLHQEVRLLPPLFREVVTLRDLNELSTEEVAGRLGISIAATKSRLSRARALLRERMERHLGGSSSSASLLML